MVLVKRLFIFLLGLLAFCETDTELSAQVSDSLLIADIVVSGNKRTKKDFVLREMTIKEGQKISSQDLDTLLRVNSNQVYNIELFNEVVIEPTYNSDESVSLEVKVRERWYILPLVYFELSDQNFNVWWKQFDHDLSRTKYGAGVEINNMRGRDEDFKFDFRLGFSRQLRFRYNIPYINKAKTMGMDFLYRSVAHDEMPIRIENNKFEFYKHDGLVDRSIETGFSLTVKKAIKHFHGFDFHYNQYFVDPIVLELSPNFFAHEGNRQKFISVAYRYTWDNRDIYRYPLRGDYFHFTVKKKGLGVWDDLDQIYIEAHYSKYWTLSRRSFLAGNIKIGGQPNSDENFRDRYRFGFSENFIRGYDPYVVEAQHYLTARTAYKQMLFNRKVHLKFIKKEQFSLIPLKVLLRVYVEGARLYGYDNEANNFLNDSYLLGSGIGLDLVTFHDGLISFEYSVNRRRERGIFVQFNITWDKG